MVHTPERAHSFIDDLQARSLVKFTTEMEEFKRELPESVELTKAGKLQPWDIAFVKNMHKRNHYNVDEQRISQYFPMKNTIKELLDIYHQFMGIDFQEMTVPGFWHEDVVVFRVINNAGDVL